MVGNYAFVYNLMKLNARTVRDAYSLPRNQDTLDCLNAAVWFTSLDLKCGYRQVKMDEASKPLAAFTVGPLGFYDCNRMPYGLTNVPITTFQRMMQSCLGNLQLQWCVIYLDGITVFSKSPKEHLHRLRAMFECL